MAALALKRTVDNWTVLSGMVSVQTFLVHIMHFLGCMYKDAPLFAMCRYISLLQWPDKVAGSFYDMDVGTLLVFDTSAQ